MKPVRRDQAAKSLSRVTTMKMMLPTEIIQAIIVHLPIDHVLANVGFVCRAFRHAMTNTLFASNHLDFGLLAQHPNSQNTEDEFADSMWLLILTQFPIGCSTAALVLDPNLLGQLSQVNCKSLIPFNFLEKLKTALLELGRTRYCHLAKIAAAKYSNFRYIGHLYEYLGHVLERCSTDGALHFCIFLIASDEVQMYRLFSKVLKHRGIHLVQRILADTQVDPSANYNCVIIWVSERGYAEIVQFLLVHLRVDPDAINSYALCLVSNNGHESVVKLLLADPRVNPESNDNCAIKSAAENRHDNVVKLLLANPCVNPGAEWNCAIRRSSSGGHTEVVKLLLVDPRVDPGANDNMAVQLASSGGCTEVVKLLLADSRVNPRAGDNNAIQLSARNGYLEVVKLLLADSRVNPAAKNNNALRLASEKGHIEVIKLLLADSRVNSVGYEIKN
ncbi:hypothetical protein HK100_008406 [Physocladia obscura]|uniref:Uncharacterized protein n=1 Tax=Physocladia obscura TaxID=109957 RepID=A0AAD5SN78_9FUNG|nr:hypothetical protein HK100_008406 [Physocladia obscura]